MHFHGKEVRKPIPSYQIFKGTVFELVDRAADFVLSKLAAMVGTRAESNSPTSAWHFLTWDLFWLRDESLDVTDNLSDPDVIAADIIEDLQAALEQFAAIQREGRAVGKNRRRPSIRLPRPRGVTRRWVASVSLS